MMHNLFVEADYVGSKGTHLLTLSDLNQFVNSGQQVLLNAQHQAVLPYPGFGLLEYSQNDGNSSYNGLDFTVERRFTAGLTFRLAYTWSKSIDDTAEELSVYGSNAFDQITNNQRSWRGPSDFDVPQRVVFSWVYEMPFRKGKPFLTSGALSKIFGGFQAAGSYSYAAGRPFTAFDSANNSSIDIGEEQALPNVIGTPACHTRSLAGSMILPIQAARESPGPTHSACPRREFLETRGATRCAVPLWRISTYRFPATSPSLSGSGCNSAPKPLI